MIIEYFTLLTFFIKLILLTNHDVYLTSLYDYI